MPQFSAKARISDDPERLSMRIREFLGVTYENQTKLRDGYDALNFWRSSLEELMVLVFQATDVDLSEMRGFSISETHLPAVVMNSKDSTYGRIFTILHEFVHIMLQDGGLCNLEDEPEYLPERKFVEVFCNRVAGAILVPKDDLLKEDLVLQHGPIAEWSDDEISELAKTYGVSREVILGRLLIFNLTTQDCYRKKKKELDEEYKKSKAEPQEGYPLYYRKVISNEGRLFIRLVLNNYYEENITASDLSDFLNIKLKHVGKIQSEVMGHSIEFGALI